jgi:hypothetical protein
MHRLLRIFVIAPVLGVLGVPSPASATNITWDFSGGAADLIGSPTSGDLGAGSRTFTSGGVSILATPSAGHLYGKHAGGDENGLGLTNDPTGDYEISGSNFIQLDLVSLLSGYNHFKFSMNSTTSGEQWKACFSSVAGAFGSIGCQTGSAEGVNIIGDVLGARYFDLKDFDVNCPLHCLAGSNVLLHTFSADSRVTQLTSTPEPATLCLFGSGLLVTARWWRKAHKAVVVSTRS